jgi:hypothetical protein
MKKFLCVAMVFAISMLTTNTAEASQKSTTLIKAFQAHLNNADSEYRQSMESAKNLFEPKIARAIENLIGAQKRFSNVNQVTILKTTLPGTNTTTITIDAVKCPTSNPDCKHPVYKTNEFTAGDISTTYDFIGGESAFLDAFNAGMNLGMLQTLDSQVKNGLISLNNSSAYLSAVSTIRVEYQSALTLSNQYKLAQSSAAIAKQEVLSRKPMIEAAIKSAKRASTSSVSFEKAFFTSFRFEYNAQRLDELAREPWGYISSLKALRDAVSVTKQSELADSISNRYSHQAADKFNRTYGNLFLNEPTYKDGFRVVSRIYKSNT